MIRRQHAFSLLQASQESPTLARLSELALESTARLRALSALIPQGLHAAIQAGPIEGGVWCLLVHNSAVAAKLRQLIPAMEAHLRSQGYTVQTIRVKVQMSHKPE